MQKKTQLLKLVVPLLPLLAIIATTFIGSLPSSLASPGDNNNDYNNAPSTPTPGEKRASSKQPGSGQYFYFVSALSSFRYLGIRNEPQSGSNVIADGKNTTDSQLWKFVGASGGYGYFQNKSGLVLDIRGGKPAPLQPVIVSEKKPLADADNQLWKFVRNGKNPEAGYIMSKLKTSGGRRLVLDIPQSSPDPNQTLIVFPINPSADPQNKAFSPNQTWVKTPAS